MPASSTSRATPKSVSRARPSGVTRMLAGLTSRCTTLRSWACCSAPSTSAASRTMCPAATPAPVAQVLGQRLPLHQLPHQVERLGVLAPVEQRDDRGVVQAARRAHLRVHARGQVELDRDALDGHLDARREVLGPVDDRGRAASQDRAEAVAAEGRRGEGGGVRPHVGGFGASAGLPSRGSSGGSRGAARRRFRQRNGRTPWYHRGPCTQDARASGGIGRHARFRV